MKQPFIFRAAVLDYMNRVSIVAGVTGAAGHLVQIAAPVEFIFSDYQDHRPIETGTLELGMLQAQSLLDALVEAGMRPTKLANPSGEIARINDHLQDMRRLVFKTERRG